MQHTGRVFSLRTLQGWISDCTLRGALGSQKPRAEAPVSLGVWRHDSVTRKDAWKSTWSTAQDHHPGDSRAPRASAMRAGTAPRRADQPPPPHRQSRRRSFKGTQMGLASRRLLRSAALPRAADLRGLSKPSRRQAFLRSSQRTPVQQIRDRRPRGSGRAGRGCHRSSGRRRGFCTSRGPAPASCRRLTEGRGTP